LSIRPTRDFVIERHGDDFLSAVVAPRAPRAAREIKVGKDAIEISDSVNRSKAVV
jgi:hypothetical protein